MFDLSYALLSPKVRKKILKKRLIQPFLSLFYSDGFNFNHSTHREKLLRQKLHGQDNLSCNI